MEHRSRSLVITLSIFASAPLVVVGAAQSGSADSTSANLAQPVVVAGGTESYDTAAGRFVRYRLPVVNWASYPAELFAAAPDLPPCGSNARSARTWVNIYESTTNRRIYGFCAFTVPQDLVSVWFAEREGTPPPSEVYVTLEDRREQRTYRSNVVRLAGEEAAAEMLYEQALDACQQGMFSNLGPASHQVVASQFALPAAATVTGIRWYGYYNANVHPDTLMPSFQISFFADSSGLPGGNPLYTGRIRARAHDTGVRLQQPYGEAAVYVFTAFSLPRVPFAAGQQVWVSIAEADPSTQPTGATQWLWNYSRQTAGGKSAFGLSQNSGPIRSWTAVQARLALALYGSTRVATPVRLESRR